MGICGNGFERLGQWLNSSTQRTTQPVTIKCKCPGCGMEFEQKHDIKATGISTNLNFNVNPGTLNPWKK